MSPQHLLQDIRLIFVFFFFLHCMIIAVLSLCGAAGFLFHRDSFACAFTSAKSSMRNNMLIADTCSRYITSTRPMVPFCCFCTELTQRENVESFSWCVWTVHGADDDFDISPFCKAENLFPLQFLTFIFGHPLKSQCFSPYGEIHKTGGKPYDHYPWLLCNSLRSGLAICRKQR